MKISVVEIEFGILLATHHPDRYLQGQIDSIRAQKNVKTKIYWIDDRSTEKEKTWVRAVLHGTNFIEIGSVSEGASNNFLNVLRFANEEYVAFADQDDIWLPDKLYNHYRAIQPYKNIPALSHSNSLLLRGDKVKSKKTRCTDHSTSRLLWENCCQGCTVVINSKARLQIVNTTRFFVEWHDWWAALIISTCGKIVCIDEPDTLYRIHSKNAIGQPRGIRRVINSLTRPSGALTSQFFSLYNSLGRPDCLTSDLELWQKMVAGRVSTRLRVALTDAKKRSTLVDDIWRRFLLVAKTP